MKSKCRHIRELLSEYIDGVMEAPEREAIKEHLHVCEDCSREYDALKSLINQLKNINEIKAPDNFMERLYERMDNDSFFDRIRAFLSFTRIRFPVEVAAFAVTAVLVLLFFSFFPAQERGIIKDLGNNNNRQTIVERTLPVRTAEKNISSGALDSPSPITQIGGKRAPVELALSITARQDTAPIPSQSVSFGGSSSEFSTDELDLWLPENNSSKKIHPDEVNSRIEEIIKSVEGQVLSRDYEVETGYPTGLVLDIPGPNYHMFISKIETVGALQHPVPSLPEGSEDSMVLIRMELTPPE